MSATKKSVPAKRELLVRHVKTREIVRRVDDSFEESTTVTTIGRPLDKAERAVLGAPKGSRW